MIQVIDFSKREDKTRLYETLKGLKPCSYWVELKQFRDTRSNRQNAYYWGVVIKILSDHTGFDPEEMHEVLKQKFLTKFVVIQSTAEEVKITRSTSNLSTEEFEKYMEDVRRFSIQDLDCFIPLPGEYIEA
jgi:hypothetical protein